MLNEMRLGKLTPTSIDSFKALEREIDYKDEVEATELWESQIYWTDIC